MKKHELSREALIEALQNDMNFTEIGRIYGVSRDTVRRRLQELGIDRQSVSIESTVDEVDGLLTEQPADSGKLSRMQAVAMALGESYPKEREATVYVPGTVEEAKKMWEDYLGYSGVPPRPAPRPTKRSGERKILLMNDIHVPYHDMDAVAKAIRAEAHDTDLCILGGDLLDLFAVSRYEKYEMHFSLEEEFRAGKALLNLLSETFPYTKVLPGNHDERWKKHLITKRGMNPGEVIAMNYLIRAAIKDDEFDITNPLYALTYDLANVEVADPVRKDYAKFGFFLQEGDLIVSHAEKFSRVTGQAANMAASWFQSNAIPLGICRPFRVLAQTHTHQAAMSWSNGGIWTFECGCLCKTPDYAAGPKLMGAQRPPILGYSVFYQSSEGRTDMTRSRFIPIEG